MYISMNWIKDFVNLDGIEPEELMKKISGMLFIIFGLFGILF